MRQSGFSLVEVIAVLLIMGVVAALAISHTHAVHSHARTRGELDKIKAHLRYAQARAMEDDQFYYGIWFNDRQYTGCRFSQPPEGIAPPKANARFSLPGEGETVVKLRSGLSLKSPRLIYFSRRGRPISHGKFQGATINFGKDATVTITAETGFIP